MSHWQVRVTNIHSPRLRSEIGAATRRQTTTRSSAQKPGPLQPERPPEPRAPAQETAGTPARSQLGSIRVSNGNQEEDRLAEQRAKQGETGVRNRGGRFNHAFKPGLKGLSGKR